MLTIDQQPDPINYSLSLPDLKVSSTHANIFVKLFRGSDLILDETYDQPPAGDKLLLKYSIVVDMLLTAQMPDYNSTISEQSDRVAGFKLEVSDEDETKTIDFRVIKGFVRSQPFDVNGFLRDSWLSLVPQVSEVSYHQPLYLTAYPPVGVTAYVKARMVSGTDKTINLGSLSANKLQSINLNPGRMIQLLGGAYQYFDVYTQQGSTILNGYRRFIYTDRFEYNADTFFYANRLGGWDTLILTGDRQTNNRNAIASAIFGDYEREFSQSPFVELQKNSGPIQSEEHRRQCVDFLNSTQRYHFHEGSLKPILLTDPAVETTHGKLNSFAFTFRYSDSKHAYPEIGRSSYHLNL